jgi:hypothetical protein
LCHFFDRAQNKSITSRGIFRLIQLKATKWLNAIVSISKGAGKLFSVNGRLSMHTELTPAEREAVDRFCQALGLALRRISHQQSTIELSHLPQPIEPEPAGTADQQSKNPGEKA